MEVPGVELTTSQRKVPRLNHSAKTDLIGRSGYRVIHYRFSHKAPLHNHIRNRYTCVKLFVYEHILCYRGNDDANFESLWTDIPNDILDAALENTASRYVFYVVLYVKSLR